MEQVIFLKSAKSKAETLKCMHLKPVVPILSFIGKYFLSQNIGKKILKILP